MDVPQIVFVLWWATLVIAVVAVLPWAVYLLHRTLMAARQIERYAATALTAGVGLAGNTANIPQLRATAPVLGADRGGSCGPGWLHERTHRRVRCRMSSTTLTILSVLLALVIVAVLAGALIVDPHKARVHFPDVGDPGDRAGGRRV